MKAAKYVMVLGELYGRSVFGPYQKCLSGEECRAMLKERNPFEDHASKARPVRARGKMGIGARRVQFWLST